MKNEIENLWHIKQTEGIAEVKKSDNFYLINQMIELLDKGKIFAVEKHENIWVVNEWIKQGILLYLATTEFILSNGWHDKVPLKFANWVEADFVKAKIRTVPGSFVRKGSFFGPSVIIMPCFVNIGANIGEGTMLDSLATIGSCVYVGKHCHISSNTVLAGVIEPIQARPVIIEDNCFIGAGCQIAEGVIIEEGSVIGAGVTITGATKIVDRASGAISFGVVPANSVVVSGSLLGENGISLNCAVIIKKVDSQTRSKTSLNDLLRA